VSKSSSSAQSSSKSISFHQHRVIDGANLIVFIKIVGLSSGSLFISFAFIDIVGLTLRFFAPLRIPRDPVTFAFSMI